MHEFPSDERVWLNYGHTLRCRGASPEAIEAYRKVHRAVSPTRRGLVRPREPQDLSLHPADVDAMQGAAGRARSCATRIARSSSLRSAKRWRMRGDFASSFAHYARGNALRRAVVHYDSDSDTRFVQRSQALYTPEFFSARAGWGYPGGGADFHRRPAARRLNVARADPRQPFPGGGYARADRRAPLCHGTRGPRRAAGKPPTYPQSVARLTRAELAALGERYLAQTRPHRQLGRPHFIDKMADQFPARRPHPSDPAQRAHHRCAALAARLLFCQFQAAFPSGAWFTYSLEDLGRYYRDYVDLMEHFERCCRGAFTVFATRIW